MWKHLWTGKGDWLWVLVLEPVQLDQKQPSAVFHGDQISYGIIMIGHHKNLDVKCKQVRGTGLGKVCELGTPEVQQRYTLSPSDLILLHLKNNLKLSMATFL